MPDDRILEPAVKRRRHSRRTARWFAFYTAVMLAVAAVALVEGELSVGLTVLAAAIVFALFTRRSWRKSRL